jgi:hypothetical protein
MHTQADIPQASEQLQPIIAREKTNAEDSRTVAQEQGTTPPQQNHAENITIDQPKIKLH